MATTQENFMTTQISTKLAALAVALMMNSVLMGGVAYLFGAPIPPSNVTSLAHKVPAMFGAV
jgi:hypothetical protein